MKRKVRVHARVKAIVCTCAEDRGELQPAITATREIAMVIMCAAKHRWRIGKSALM